MKELKDEILLQGMMEALQVEIILGWLHRRRRNYFVIMERKKLFRDRGEKAENYFLIL